MESNSFGWIGLSAFLLVMLLIMTIFYSYILTTRVDPASCPKSFGDYGVIAGKTGIAVNSCDGICQFLVKSLYDATIRCDSDNRCQAFYYDGVRMIYVDPTSPLITTIPGGLYIRQKNLIR